MVDLSTNFLDLKLCSPLIVGPGPLTMTAPDILQCVEQDGVGAVVLKSTTPEKREPHPQPHWVWIGNGLINAQGNPNPGYEVFAEVVTEILRNKKKPIFASLIASSHNEYMRMAVKMEEVGIDGIEIPLAAYKTDDWDDLCFLIEKLRKTTQIPVIAKLWYDWNIHDLAVRMESAGASAITLIGSLPAIALDVETSRSVLGSPYGFGGLTGPCIKPLTQRCLAIVAKKVDIPIIACGGISNAIDVIETLSLGASCVAIVTAAIKDGRNIFLEISDQLKKYFSEQKYSKPEDIVGTALMYLD